MESGRVGDRKRQKDRWRDERKRERERETQESRRERGSAVQAGRGESGRSAAPLTWHRWRPPPRARPGDLRGALGAGLHPSLPYLASPGLCPRAKLGLSCQHPGARDSCHLPLHLPRDQTPSFPPATRPAQRRPWGPAWGAPKGKLGIPRSPRQPMLWDQPGWAPWDKGQPDSGLCEVGWPQQVGAFKAAWACLHPP